MNTINKLLTNITLICIIFTLNSCNKDENNDNISSTNTNATYTTKQVVYFDDNDSLNFDLSACNYILDGEDMIDDTLFIEEIGDELIQLFDPETPEYIFCFSNESIFIDWLNSHPHGVEIEERHNSINEMRDFIIENGIDEDVYEETGELPEELQEMIRRINDHYHNSKASTWTNLYNYKNYKGSRFTMPLFQYPSFGSFRNKAESLKSYGTLIHALCDRRWWRGRRMYFIGLPYVYISDLGSFRNKAESSSIL